MKAFKIIKQDYITKVRVMCILSLLMRLMQNDNICCGLFFHKIKEKPLRLLFFLSLRTGTAIQLGWI